MTFNDRPAERALDGLSIAGPELSRLLLRQGNVIHQRLHECRISRPLGIERLHPPRLFSGSLSRPSQSNLAPGLPGGA